MPTYEYKCEACGATFERFQSIKAAPIRKCPVCGKNRVQRLISTGAGLIFKGSGFYITDYRSESYKESAKSESGDGKKETAKTETPAAAGSDKQAAPAPKPEAKPVAKSETKP